MMLLRFRPTPIFIGLAFFFFAAATRASYAQSWIEYSYPSDGFAISGESAPAPSTQTAQTKVGPVPTRIWTWDFSATAVVLAVNDYPSVNASVQEVLDNAAGGEASAWKGGHIVSKTPIVFQGVSGLECVIDGDEFHGRSRLFFRGLRLWQIISLSATGQPLYAQTDRMFASFRFVQAP
jgi:hypothetical protein